MKSNIKRMKKYILFAAAAVSLAACNSEDNYIDEPVAARFSATIGENVISRARDIEWDKGDNIGITMSGLYTNIEHTTQNADGVFIGSAMYFKNKKDPVSIIAYYPFAGTEGQEPAVIEVTTSADRQTPAEQPKIDFMHATMDAVTGAQPNVNLQFSHKMSKLTLIFKNGNDGTDVGKITSYEIDGLILDGAFNPVDGVCGANPDAEAQSIKVDMPLGTVTHGERVFPLILFPQAVNKLAMKIHDSENQNYVCELNIGANGLVAGNNYLFTITVKKTSLSVNSTIIDWNTEESTSGAMSDDSDD